MKAGSHDFVAVEYSDCGVACYGACHHKFVKEFTEKMKDGRPLSRGPASVATWRKGHPKLPRRCRVCGKIIEKGEAT